MFDVFLHKITLIAETAGQDSSSSTQKPTFTQKPFIRQLEDKVFFECKLSADPLPSIVWELDGKVLTNTTKYKQRFDIKSALMMVHILIFIFYRILSESISDTVILEIWNVNAKDSGDYKVIAKNLHGEGHANIKLNIQTNKLDKYFLICFLLPLDYKNSIEITRELNSLNHGDFINLNIIQNILLQLRDKRNSKVVSDYIITHHCS